DSVRAKLEANRDLSSKVLSIDFSTDDFAKKMVELINEKKSQGNNWKMGQLKKLKPDKLKEEFDKCVEKVEKFIPMNSELKASKLKRTGINLQAKVFKKQKITDVPDVTKDESQGKDCRRISKSARSVTEEDVEAYMDERVDEPSSEEEDHTDILYVNFQGLLNDLTSDDLKELYRLMMLKYGDSRPKEEYERVLWGDLKTMFDPPSIEDAVWSLTHQQKNREPLPGDILGVTTLRDTSIYYPKRYWEILPKEILGDTTQRDIGRYYPKRYWEILPKEILGDITQRDIGRYYPKRYFHVFRQ
ncbi:hypothetical protein Tco_1364807, partial [Tanacetum coccineum]